MSYCINKYLKNCNNFPQYHIYEKNGKMIFNVCYDCLLDIEHTSKLRIFCKYCNKIVLNTIRGCLCNIQ